MHELLGLNIILKEATDFYREHIARKYVVLKDAMIALI